MNELCQNVSEMSAVGIKSDFWSKAVEKIRSGLLPRLDFAEERPVNESDFRDHFARSLEALDSAISVCENIDPEKVRENSDVLKHFVVSLLLLCSENSQKFDWTKLEHIEKSYRVLTLLKSRIFEVSAISQILLNSDKVLRWTLEELRLKLNNKLWKKYPGAQQSFVWALNQLSFPHMSAYVSEFLPFSLQFTDDWEPTNQVIGVQCLRHVVGEISPTELKWYGRAELINATLLHLMHSKEIDLLEVLFPTLTEFLEKTEGSKRSAEQYARFDGWDGVLHKLLLSMEIESKTDLKRVYVKHLAGFLQHVGLGCVRWLTLAISVLGHYLAYPDPEDEEVRVSSVSCLKFLTSTAKERIPFHAQNILEPLLRVIYEISRKQTIDKNLSDRNLPDNKLLELCVDCVCECASHAPSEFQKLCSGLDKLKVNPIFDSAIQKAFQKATIVSPTNL